MLPLFQGLLVVLLLLLEGGAFGRHVLSLQGEGVKPSPHTHEYAQLTEDQVDNVAFIIEYVASTRYFVHINVLLLEMYIVCSVPVFGFPA